MQCSARKDVISLNACAAGSARRKAQSELVSSYSTQCWGSRCRSGSKQKRATEAALTASRASSRQNSHSRFPQYDLREYNRVAITVVAGFFVCMLSTYLRTLSFSYWVQFVCWRLCLLGAKRQPSNPSTCHRCALAGLNSLSPLLHQADYSASSLYRILTINGDTQNNCVF